LDRFFISECDVVKDPGGVLPEASLAVLIKVRYVRAAAVPAFSCLCFF